MLQPEARQAVGEAGGQPLSQIERRQSKTTDLFLGAPCGT